MLTLLLVWTVALGSLSIFLAGMIFPEVSRKNDLIWVGVGLFYALLLWANKNTMGGGLLLGQTAGISMMVWLGWQAMSQRRELTAPEKQTPVPDWLQKIIDVMVPLWEKAYGAIAGQLGIEDSTEASSEEALGGIKSQVMGFLDKLNNKPEGSDTATAPPADADDIEDDWEEDQDPAPAEQVVAETVEAEPESTPQPDVEAVAEPEASDETEGSPETEPLAEVEAQAGAEAAPVAESEPVAEPEPVAESEGGEAVEAEAEAVNKPRSTESEAAVAEPVETPVNVAAPPEPVPVEAPESVAPESTSQEESNWPDAQPMNSGDPQEESNWPPNEPVD